MGDDEAAPFDLQRFQTHLPALYARFPENKDDIDRYVREAGEACDSLIPYALSRLLPFSWQKFLAPYLLKTFHKHASITQLEALQKITKNPKLASLLGSLWIDICVQPHRATWFLGASISFAIFYGRIRYNY